MYLTLTFVRDTNSNGVAKIRWNWQTLTTIDFISSAYPALGTFLEAFGCTSLLTFLSSQCSNKHDKYK